MKYLESDSELLDRSITWFDSLVAMGDKFLEFLDKNREDMTDSDYTTTYNHIATMRNHAKSSREFIVMHRK